MPLCMVLDYTLAGPVTLYHITRHDKVTWTCSDWHTSNQHYRVHTDLHVKAPNCMGYRMPFLARSRVWRQDKLADMKTDKTENQ